MNNVLTLNIQKPPNSSIKSSIRAKVLTLPLPKEKSDRIELPDPKKAKITGEFADKFKEMFEGKAPEHIQELINDGFLRFKKDWDELLEQKPESMPMPMWLMMDSEAVNLIGVYFQAKHMTEEIGLIMPVLDPRISGEIVE